MPDTITAVTEDHVEGTVDLTQPHGGYGVPFAAAPWPEHLDEAVGAYVTHHAEIADRELDGSDPLLFPVRSRVRAAVEPLLGAFDAQLEAARNAARRPGPTADEFNELDTPNGRLYLADVRPSHPNHAEAAALRAEIAQRGTLTRDGLNMRTAEIARNRRAAVDGALKPLRDALADVEEKARAQRAAARPRPGAADVEAAVELMLQLERTIPRHGAPILAEYVAAAAAARDPARAAALLPMLKSLHDAPDGPWSRSPELRALVEKAERLAGTWQQTVAAARLERVAKTRRDLDQYAYAAAAGTSLVDAEGNHRLFPDEPPPEHRLQVDIPARRKPVRFLRKPRGE